MLKADDNNRAIDEMHTTLTLTGLELTAGQELYMGWAMVMTESEDLLADEAKGETTEDYVDRQGTTRQDLIAKAEAHTGERGWNGPSYWRTYNGENETGGWNVEETYSMTEPDVFNFGVEDLVADPDGNNSFLVQNEYSEITSSGGVVYSERVWDSQ